MGRLANIWASLDEEDELAAPSLETNVTAPLPPGSLARTWERYAQEPDLAFAEPEPPRVPYAGGTSYAPVAPPEPFLSVPARQPVPSRSAAPVAAESTYGAAKVLNLAQDPGFLAGFSRGLERGRIGVAESFGAAFEGADIDVGRPEPPGLAGAARRRERGEEAAKAPEPPTAGPPDPFRDVPWSEKWTSPEFWGQFIAENSVSSAPFFGGAVAGGVAGAVTPLPGGALVGAMLGGGAAVGMQTIGGEYLGHIRNGLSHDEASEKAVLAGLASAGINAASLPAGLLLPFKGLIANALLQMFVLQPGVGLVDAATGNIVAERKVTEGLGEAYVAEAMLGLAEPVVAAGARGRAPLKGAAETELRHDPDAPSTMPERISLVKRLTAAGEKPVQWIKRAFDKRPGELTKGDLEMAEAMLPAEEKAEEEAQAEGPTGLAAPPRPGQRIEVEEPAAEPEAAPEPAAEAPQPIRPTVTESPVYIEVVYPDQSRGPEEAQRALHEARFRFRKNNRTGRMVWQAATKGKGITEDLLAQRRAVAQGLIEEEGAAAAAAEPETQVAGQAATGERRPARGETEVAPSEDVEAEPVDNPWAMSRENVEAALETVTDRERRDEAEALGSEEAAKRWRRLQAAANSTFDLQRADAASAEIAKIDAGLNDRQRALIYGSVNDPRLSREELRELRRAHEAFDPEADPDFLYGYLRRELPRVRPDAIAELQDLRGADVHLRFSELVSAVKIREAINALFERGIDEATIMTNVDRQLAEQRIEAADREILLGEWIAAARRMKGRPRLAPPPAASTPERAGGRDVQTPLAEEPTKGAAAPTAEVARRPVPMPAALTPHAIFRRLGGLDPRVVERIRADLPQESGKPGQALRRKLREIGAGTNDVEGLLEEARLDPGYASVLDAAGIRTHNDVATAIRTGRFYQPQSTRPGEVSAQQEAEGRGAPQGEEDYLGSLGRRVRTVSTPAEVMQMTRELEQAHSGGMVEYDDYRALTQELERSAQGLSEPVPFEPQAEYTQPLLPGEQRELPRGRKPTAGGKRLEGTPLFEALEEKKAEAEKKAAPQLDLFGGVAEAGADYSAPDEVEAARRAWQEQGTESPWFRRWFGESKAVDDSGKPLALFHSGAFDEAEGDAIPETSKGMHFGTQAAAEMRQPGKAADDFIREANVLQEENEDGELRWWWESQGQDSYDTEPDGFATEEEARGDLQAAAESVADADVATNEASPLTQAYLNIRNPMRVRDQGDDWTAAIARAKKLGHDGLVYRNLHEDAGRDSYVVFSPEQIKSTGNRGTFSPEDPSIVKQVGPVYQLDLFNKETLDAEERELSTTSGSLARSDAGGIRRIAAAIQTDLRATGHVDLSDKTVNSAHEVAKIAQVWRNPRYEALRLIYTDARGRVLGHEAFSSRTAGYVGSPLYETKEGRDVNWGHREVIARNFSRFQDRIKRLGKGGEVRVWVLHNHPSGDPTPSTDDVKFSELFGDQIAQVGGDYQGHVIIDTDQFALISPSAAEGGGLTRGVSVHALESGRSTILPPGAVPEVEFSGLLGTQVAKPDDVAKIGRQLKTPDGFVSLIYWGSRGKVMALEEVPIGFYQSEEFAGYLRNRNPIYGAAKVIPYYGGKKLRRTAFTDASTKLIRAGLAYDAVYNADEKWGTVESLRGGGVAEDKQRGVGVVRVAEEEAPYDADAAAVAQAARPGAESKGEGALSKARQRRADSKELEKQLKAKITRYSTGEFADRIFGKFEGGKGIANKVLTETVEDMRGLDVFVGAVEDLTGEKLSVVNSPAKRERLFRGHRGLAEVMAETWGNVVRRAGGSRHGSLSAEDRANFDLFIHHKSIVRREGILKGRSKKAIQQMNPDEVTAAEARGVLADLRREVGAEKYADYETAARNLGRFWQVLWKYVYDSGLVDEKTHKQVLADQMHHGDYLGPFNVLEHVAEHLDKPEAMPKSLSVYNQDVVKRMVGTTKKIASLLESSPRKIYRSVQVAERNKVMAKLYALKGLHPDMEQVIIDLEESEAAPQGYDRVWFYDKGQRRGFALPAPVADAVRGMDKPSSHWFLRMMRKGGVPLRFGAVSAAPTFPVRNIPRDWGTQLAKADVPLTPKDVGLWLDSLVTSLFPNGSARQRRLFREYRKWGAAYTSRTAQLKPEKQVSELTQGYLGRLGDHPASFVGRTVVDALTTTSQATEESVRFAGFRKTREAALAEGASPEEASMEGGHAARANTIDFARGGDFMKTLSMISPFTSARAQGLRVTVEGAKAHPLRVGSILAAGMVAQAMIAMRNRIEFGDEWDDVPPEVKSDNWVWVVGSFMDAEGLKRPMYYTLAKPEWFRPSAILVEGFLDHLYGKAPDVYHMALAAISELSPVDIERKGELAWDRALAGLMGPMATGVLGAALNRDIYFGTDIYYGGARKPEDRYNPYTSFGARWLGKQAGVPPAQLEYFIRANGGEFGTLVLRSPEWFMGEPDDRRQMMQGIHRVGPVVLDEKHAFSPVIRAFFSTRGGEQRSAFFDAMHRAEDEIGSVDFKAREKAMGLIARAPSMTKAEVAAELLSLSPVERRSFLREIERRKKGMAGSANAPYRYFATLGIKNGERALAIRHLFTETLTTNTQRIEFLRGLSERKLTGEHGEILAQVLEMLSRGMIPQPVPVEQSASSGQAIAEGAR